jgi:Cof subfamily protein (haloacid dehalogenase superfamily)
VFGVQGLAVHGHEGQQLSDASLPPQVVSSVFKWASQQQVSCVAFLGDECATLKLTDELVELHTRYYEPLAQECSSIEQLLSGPSVRKLLFMTDPSVVDGLLKPYWGAALQGEAAEVLQAVPNMLEVVPAGVNKWAGLQVLLQHMQIDPQQLMAVGDGSNDLELVANAGIGVAMGNAVPSVKAAATVVVASNDDGGIVEAFERFVL